MTKTPDYVQSLAAVQPLLAGADHYDCTSIAGTLGLREFLAGIFNYDPPWLRMLYRIRWGFVRLLGMQQAGIPVSPRFQPKDISFKAGAAAHFFTVAMAEEDHYWVATVVDRHLSAYLIVAAEPLRDRQHRFHVATVVHYNNWAGPVYFNVIRPFHHLVIRAMMRAGIQQPINTKGLRDA